MKLKRRNPKKQRSSMNVELGRVLAEGGEGKIHEIVGRPAFVAKVYHEPPSKEKAAKLAAMVECSTKKLLFVAAWPVELLREQLVEIVQAEPYQPLHVRRVDPDPDALPIEDVQITTA